MSQFPRPAGPAPQQPGAEQRFHLASEDPADTSSLMRRILTDFLAEVPPPPAGGVQAVDLLTQFSDYADWWLARNIGSVGDGLYGVSLRLHDGTPLLLSYRQTGEGEVLPPDPPAVQGAMPTQGAGVPVLPQQQRRSVREGPVVQGAFPGRRPADGWGR